MSSRTNDRTPAPIRSVLTPQAHGAGLAPLLCPAAVAVVGTGRTGTGHDILEALCSGGFTGRLYAVDREGCLVCGLLARPSLRDLPEPVDLVVIAVPPERVLAVLADAVRAGARAALIVTPEAEDQSATMPWPEPAELERFARTEGIRVVGPGSGGVLVTDPAIRLNATYAAALPVRGGLAVVSHTGTEGTALIEELHGAGLAVHSYLSLGDSSDVTAADLVQAWAQDDSVDAVAVVLGSLQHRPAVWASAQEAARRKPVLTLCTAVAGRPARDGADPAGGRPAADLLATALRQAGVVDVSSLDELLDAARLLSGQPYPAGPRLGVIGNAPELDNLIVTTARELGLVLPDGAGLPNPWDLPLVADPVRFADAVALALDSGQVDQLLAVVTPNSAGDLASLLRTIARELDRRPEIPAAVVVPGHGGRTIGDRRLPVFDSVERATRALGRATGYALRGGGTARGSSSPESPEGEAATASMRRHWRLTLQPVDRVAARQVLEAALAAGEGRQPLLVAEALLRAYGLPVATSEPAASEDEAVTLASANYPVAVKAADPRLDSKSEVGAVVLDVADPNEVRAAYRYLTGGVDGHPAGVTVQRMLSCRSELEIDFARDTGDGPVLALALIDCSREPTVRRAACPPPTSFETALAAWHSLDGPRAGRRGHARGDDAAVAELLARVGELVQEIPQIRGLSLHPVLLHPTGLVAVDVKLVLQRC